MKKKKRRGLKIFLLSLLTIVVVLVMVFLLCAYVFKLGAKEIIIHNNKIINDDKIIELSKINKDSNFILLNSKEIVKNIKEDKLINEVKVKRNIFFEVHIYIKEAKPLFIREDTSRLVLNNKKEIESKDYYKLNVPHLVNYVPDKVYFKLITKMDKSDYKIIAKISDIKYYPNNYDAERFILYMIDNNLVYINLPKFKSINDYNKMVEKFEGKTGILYLDSGNYFEYKDTKNNNSTKEKTSKKESETKKDNN